MVIKYSVNLHQSAILSINFYRALVESLLCSICNINKWNIKLVFQHFYGLNNWFNSYLLCERDSLMLFDIVLLLDTGINSIAKKQWTAINELHFYLLCRKY